MPCLLTCIRCCFYYAITNTIINTIANTRYQILTNMSRLDMSSRHSVSGKGLASQQYRVIQVGKNVLVHNATGPSIADHQRSTKKPRMGCTVPTLRTKVWRPALKDKPATSRWH